MNTASPEIVIDVSELSKKYFLYQSGNKVVEEFYALNKISFQAHKNKSIGIIGKNGSGKSTFLKLLSGLIKPSEGKIVIKGKVNSILEIGSNFIPELSGRENLNYFLKLNDIHEANLSEIIQKVIDFSELKKSFIDESLKNYSSGMFLRLALSAYFHIKTDIFLFDEILSVGDASFREKIKEHFQKLNNTGTCMLMASHNPEEIINNCEECIWLDNGSLKMHGTAKNVTDEYQYQLAKENSETKYYAVFNSDKNDFLSKNISNETNNDSIRLIEFSVTAPQELEQVRYDTGFDINIKVEKKKSSDSIHPMIKIFDLNMQAIMILAIDSENIAYEQFHSIKLQKCIFSIKCQVPPNLLSFGSFYAELRFGKNLQVGKIYSELALLKPQIIKFDVLPGKAFDFTGGTEDVFIKPKINWSFSTEPSLDS